MQFLLFNNNFFSKLISFRWQLWMSNLTENFNRWVLVLTRKLFASVLVNMSCGWTRRKTGARNFRVRWWFGVLRFAKQLLLILFNSIEGRSGLNQTGNRCNQRGFLVCFSSTVRWQLNSTTGTSTQITFCFGSWFFLSESQQTGVLMTRASLFHQ